MLHLPAGAARMACDIWAGQGKTRCVARRQSRIEKFTARFHSKKKFSTTLPFSTTPKMHHSRSETSASVFPASRRVARRGLPARVARGPASRARLSRAAQSVGAMLRDSRLTQTLAFGSTTSPSLQQVQPRLVLLVSLEECFPK